MPDLYERIAAHRDGKGRIQIFRVLQPRLWHRPEASEQGKLVPLLAFLDFRIETPVLF